MKNDRNRLGVSRLFRRLLGLTLAVCLLVGGSATAWADAVSTYTVSVSQGLVTILKSGYVTNTFRTGGNNLTISSGVGGNLQACFYDASGKYVGVDLGSQEILTVYGAIGTLRLDTSLNRPVVIAASATVSNLTIDAPVKVSVWGKVAGGSVNAAATVVAAKGSSVSDLFFYNSRAAFYHNDGSVIDGTTMRSSQNAGAYRYGTDQSGSSSGSSSGNSLSSSSNTTSSTSSGITLRSLPIYAVIGETLSDLELELEYNVTARTTGGRVLSGDFEWVDRGSTRLWESKSYKFYFHPHDGDYDTVIGSVRIIVDDDEDYKNNVTLEINGPIYTNYDNKRLSYFLTKLESKVRAYNEDGRYVSGKVRWSKSTSKVSETGTYKFTFTPNNPMYRTVTGEIEIVVEN